VERRETIAVAGASGFVGTALAPLLARAGFTTVGLSRGKRDDGSDGYDTWRSADLFSLLDAQLALRGADRAVYLVHSMMPSARLTQGSFEDFDLVCADNFGRAAKKEGVKQIVYLGGLLPEDLDDDKLSRHLASRREVETALAAHGVPVTTLRASLVIGAGGSSFSILERLVRRLPLMLCPAWTRTLTQPIALADVVELLTACLGRDDVLGETFDVGGPDVVTYEEMMRATALALGVRRPMLRVPLLTIGLSRLWVTLITGAPKELVAPLIHSLVVPMVARDRRLQEKLGRPGLSLAEALSDAIAAERALAARAAKEHGKVPRASRLRGRQRAEPRARSVQRMVLPPGKNALWTSDEYARWLPFFFRHVVLVDVDADKNCVFHLSFGKKRRLLELRFSTERSTGDRVLFYVGGGELAKVRQGARPRFEIREVNGGAFVLTAIHDYEPALPWRIYACTQALFHLFVMRAFARHLSRIARGAPALG